MTSRIIADVVWYGLIVLPTFVLPARICLEWEAWFASGATFKARP